MSKFQVSFDPTQTIGFKIPYLASLRPIGNTPTDSMYSYDVAFEFAHSNDANSLENRKKLDQWTGESPKFQIVIPKQIREMLQLKPGEKMCVIELLVPGYIHLKSNNNF